MANQTDPWFLSIDGVVVPAMSTYKAETADLVDSGRNADGVMVGQVVRYDVASIKATWALLTVGEWANICALFKGKFQHNVVFLNQTTGNIETRTFYGGNRSGEMIKLRDGSVRWKGCSVNLAEV